MKNKTNEVEISFHSLFVFIIAEKKRKKRLSNSVSSFNKQHSFILTHSISLNQSNQSQAITITITMRRGKGENEHHQQPSNKSKTPSFNARVERGRKQTTLPQLPAFPAFCKCNEHPITSNAH